MSASKRTGVPSYRLHKASGQAVVTLDGKDRYLGRHGSPESRAHYERLIAEYLAGGRRLPDAAGRQYAVGELSRDFLDWAEREYRLPDGRQSGGVGNVRIALKPLVELYLDLPVADFGPRALKLYRERLIESGLARTTINDRVGIVRRAFRWGTENELVPPAAYQGLRAVEGLKRARSGVREAPGVKPVPEGHIEKALPFMPPFVQTMVRLQLLTAMRPEKLPAMLERRRKTMECFPMLEAVGELGAVSWSLNTSSEGDVAWVLTSESESRIRAHPALASRMGGPGGRSPPATQRRRSRSGV